MRLSTLNYRLSSIFSSHQIEKNVKYCYELALSPSVTMLKMKLDIQGAKLDPAKLAMITAILYFEYKDALENEGSDEPGRSVILFDFLRWLMSTDRFDYHLNKRNFINPWKKALTGFRYGYVPSDFGITMLKLVKDKDPNVEFGLETKYLNTIDKRVVEQDLAMLEHKLDEKDSTDGK